jgi:hypothetical protein
MGKVSTPDTGEKKKATFAETVSKDTVEEKEIDYKTCVVVGGAIIKLAKIFFGLNDIFMHEWCATMSPLNFFEKNPSGVSSMERFASFD